MEDAGLLEMLGWASLAGVPVTLMVCALLRRVWYDLPVAYFASIPFSIYALYHGTGTATAGDSLGALFCVLLAPILIIPAVSSAFFLGRRIYR